MTSSKNTVTTSRVPTGAPIPSLFSQLMPLSADAQLFFSLLPESGATDDIEIMNDRFAGRGKNAAWLPIRTTDAGLDGTVQTLKLFGNLAGLAIHAPFQQAMLRHLDSLSPLGRLAGIADVARRTADGGWEGGIAALPAFRRTLRAEGVDPHGAKVWLIGADGRAVASALSLAEQGVASLTVADKRLDAAMALTGRVRAAFPGLPVSVGVPGPESIDIVVDNLSATGAGTAQAMASPEKLRPDTLVIDGLARRTPGRFVATSRKAGLPVIGGDCLLVQLLAVYDEFFGWSRIPYKDGTLRDAVKAAA